MTVRYIDLEGFNHSGTGTTVKFKDLTFIKLAPNQVYPHNDSGNNHCNVFIVEHCEVFELSGFLVQGAPNNIATVEKFVDCAEWQTFVKEQNWQEPYSDAYEKNEHHYHTGVHAT